MLNRNLRPHQIGSAFLCYFLLKRQKKVEQFYLICPSPVTNHFSVTSFSSANGPLACNFCVEMPISAPSPNSAPSVNRVDALAYTTAASTSFINRSHTSLFSDTMASECLVEYF